MTGSRSIFFFRLRQQLSGFIAPRLCLAFAGLPFKLELAFTIPVDLLLCNRA